MKNVIPGADRLNMTPILYDLDTELQKPCFQFCISNFIKYIAS